MHWLLDTLAPYKFWFLLVPIQIAWLSIPFWLAAARTRSMRLLAQKHGFYFHLNTLPPEFPFQAFFPDQNRSDARNIISGVQDGDPVIAFDLGSAYSRSQRPQTIVARYRTGTDAPPAQPPPALYTLRQSHGWTIVSATRNAAERVFMGVTQSAVIEQLWNALGRS